MLLIISKCIKIGSIKGTALFIDLLCILIKIQTHFTDVLTLLHELVEILVSLEQIIHVFVNDFLYFLQFAF